ncbi:hypothetical protein K1719_008868 [Acacia pycnantha]|nr:hypothetical protein K1719_008868 [Acacia pycnantha]
MESHAEHVKRIFRYLADTKTLGLWFPKDQHEHLVAYTDSDHAGYKTDEKAQVVNYVAASSCCAQVLWLKQQLCDLGVHLKEIPILCDNTSTISLAKNPVQHTRTKHIDVRHHFIRDHVQKKDVKVMFIPTHLQLADIFTKPLAKEQFVFIRRELGMVNPNEL